MLIYYDCVECGNEIAYEQRELHAGQLVTCNKCGAEYRVTVRK